MQEVYILQDQNNLYLTKQGTWHNGSEANTLYRTPHKDEAVNTRAEHSVKSPHLRISLLTVQCSEKGVPQVKILAPILQEQVQQSPDAPDSETDATPHTL